MTAVPHPPLRRARRQDTRTVTATGLVVAAAYVGTIVTASWTSTHWPAIVLGPLIIPAGTLWAGATFTLRDLLHESLGTGGVVAGIVAGTGVSWVLASPQIAIASVLAFAVSEALDSVIYAVLRRGSRMRAVLGSNLVGLLADSLLFVPLAFGSLAAVPGQLVGKTAATIVTLTLLAVAGRQSCRRAVPR